MGKTIKIRNGITNHFNGRKNENYSIIELKDQSKAVDLIYNDYYKNN